MGNYIPTQPPPGPDALMPRYPVYIPSKGRFTSTLALTARWFDRDGVPYKLVVEENEAEEYVKLAGEEKVLVLPFSNLGLGAVPARNWIKDYSTDRGEERHWQFDDNTYGFYRLFRNKRLPCRAGLALRVCEDLTDRYENVALSGLNYDMFGVNARKPFVANCHVYSATLVNNAIPHHWRGRYNDDTDICLQVLSDGWCTILLNAFLVKKKWTMTMKGGMTDSMYGGDGRLKMAKSLERKWPYVVETKRRFQRPQHVIRYAWGRFDTPLKLKEGIDLSALPTTDEYGMKILETSSVKSEQIRKLAEEYRAAQAADDVADHPLPVSEDG